MAESQPTKLSYDQQMVSLSRLLKALRSSSTANEAISLAIDHVHQQLDFDVAWIGLYDRTHHRLLTKGCHSPSSLRSIRTVINLTPGDVMEQVVIQQRPLIVVDLQNEIRAGEWGQIAHQLSLQSAIIYPIKRQEVCFGLLVLASSRWGLTSSLGERSYLSIITGGLAEALHHFEAEQQRQQAKRLEQPLLALLGKLGSLPNVDGQLREVVRETQRFITPTQTRVFWFEPKGNYFWQRLPTLAPRSTESLPGEPRPALQIPVEDIRGLYQALCNQQLVVVGESSGALKTVVSDRLMQQLQAQSLMIAPLAIQADLAGFLVVEGNLPRIWQESEKQFLMGIARLLSLALPTAAASETQRQTQLEQHLMTGVIQGIHGDVDWQHTLQTCFSILQDRLAIQQFFVLLFNPDHNGYDLCFQGQASRPRTVPMLWPCLNDADWQILEQSQSPVVIDNLHTDPRLMAWCPQLIDLGAQSAVVGNVSPGNAPEGVVIITDHISRQWTSTEQELFKSMGRQIGVILHQWQLQRQISQQQHIYEAIQWGLQALHQGLHPEQLEQTTLAHTLQLLQGSMVFLMAWPPGQSTATISQTITHDSSIWLKEDHPIPVGSDAMLNWALQTDGPLPLVADELPEATQAWFAPPAGSRLLAMALRTAPSHLVNAVVVLVSPPHRSWINHQITIFKLLISQLAWSRRHLTLAAMLTHQRQDLEHLNWYKHHRLADLCRALGQLTQDLNSWQSRREGLTLEQPMPFLNELQAVLQGIEPLLKTEQWQLVSQYQTMPLVSLLNRLMERINPLLEAKQLWSKVHNESNVILGSDMSKLELILYEVMVAACRRSPSGGRIDIWCRTLNLDWLELSITDDGRCKASFLEELNASYPPDVLASSTLDEPPGLHLWICKTLLEQLGGEMAFSTLDDGRTHSRVLLPLATHVEQQKYREALLNLTSINLDLDHGAELPNPT